MRSRPRPGHSRYRDNFTAPTIGAGQTVATKSSHGARSRRWGARTIKTAPEREIMRNERNSKHDKAEVLMNSGDHRLQHYKDTPRLETLPRLGWETAKPQTYTMLSRNNPTPGHSHISESVAVVNYPSEDQNKARKCITARQPVYQTKSARRLSVELDRPVAKKTVWAQADSNTNNYHKSYDAAYRKPIHTYKFGHGQRKIVPKEFNILLETDTDSDSTDEDPRKRKSKQDGKNGQNLSKENMTRDNHSCSDTDCDDDKSCSNGPILTADTRRKLQKIMKTHEIPRPDTGRSNPFLVGRNGRGKTGIGDDNAGTERNLSENQDFMKSLVLANARRYQHAREKRPPLKERIEEFYEKIEQHCQKEKKDSAEPPSWETARRWLLLTKGVKAALAESSDDEDDADNLNTI